MTERRKRRWLRTLLVVLGALVGLVLVGVGTVYAVSEAGITQSFDLDPAPLEVDPSEALVERGRAVATYRGCVDCHGADGGGKLFIDAMPVMRLFAPNLTRGGIGASYRDEDWARAIRHGVRPDGSPILFMPSQEWTALSHEDLAAIIAYLRSLPPVERDHESSSVGPLGRVLYLAGELPLVPAELVDHRTQPASPTPGPTAEYGRYLVTACTGCHGEHLSGGPIPGVPPEWPEAPNLTSHETGLANWTEQQFIDTLRTGRTPSGRALAREYMPWPNIAHSNEDDLRALWQLLQSLEPRPRGQR